MKSLARAWSRLAHGRNDTRVVFVARRYDSLLEHACSAKDVRAELLLDPDGAAARRLNAGWLPRAFTAQGGRLVYVQPDTTPDSHAAPEAEGAWAISTAGPTGTPTGP